MDVREKLLDVLVNHFGSSQASRDEELMVFDNVVSDILNALDLGPTGTPCLKPMSEARKDGTRILVRFRSDLTAYTRRPHHKPWEGRWAVVCHPGLAPDGFDVGWQIAAPVGSGGFEDTYFDGWLPVPEKAAAPRDVDETRAALVTLDGDPFTERDFNPERICNDRGLAQTRECHISWLETDEGAIDGVTCMEPGCDYLVHDRKAAKAAADGVTPEEYARQYPAVAYRETIGDPED